MVLKLFRDDWEQFGNNLYICTVTKNPDYESNSLYPKIRK